MATPALLSRIRREFQDHPGIAVTVPQAQRLWVLDQERCLQAFGTLVAEGFLAKVNDVYLWVDAPMPRFRRRVAAPITTR